MMKRQKVSVAALALAAALLLPACGGRVVTPFDGADAEAAQGQDYCTREGLGRYERTERIGIDNYKTVCSGGDYVWGNLSPRTPG